MKNKPGGASDVNEVYRQSLGMLHKDVVLSKKTSCPKSVMFNPDHALELRDEGLIQIWVSDVV